MRGAEDATRRPAAAIWLIGGALLATTGGAAAQPYVYVANLGSDDVSIIDTATRGVTATLSVGDDPNGVAVSPDGTRAYVTNFLGGTLTVIDTERNAIVATVPVGEAPVGVAVAVDGRAVYVADRGADSVAVVDTAAASVRAVVPVGRGPNAVAVTPDGRTAYVTNSFTRAPGEVSVLDLVSGRVRATVPVHSVPNRVAVSPDGTRVYVTNFRGWNLSVIDAATDAVLDTLRVGRKPTSVAVNPNGAYVYVTTLGDGDPAEANVQIVETATNRVTGSLLAGLDAWALATERRGGIGYVANFGADTVTVLDLADEAVLGEIAVGDRPFALSVNCFGGGCAEPPYTPKPTRTPTVTPTVTRTPTITSTVVFPTAERTHTPGPTPPPAIFLQIGAASGRPGERVSIDVRLDVRGRAIAGTQNDILFGPTVPIASRSNGLPDCTVNPAIDKAATAFRFQPPGCEPGQCTAARALVLSLDNTDPIPDGSVLYTCHIDIAATAAPGFHPLHLDNLGASTPDGAAVATGAIEGGITVSPVALGLQNAAGGQGVCEGGADDGLLCDCPGGSCTGQAACQFDAQRGTCRGGAADGACCDRSFDCSDGAPCTPTSRLCAAGPSKGMPCLGDHHCVGAACIAVARACKGGSFDAVACIDDGDCPRGACVNRSISTPSSAQPSPTPTGLSISSSTDGGGCAVTDGPSSGGVWCLLGLAPIFLARRIGWSLNLSATASSARRAAVAGRRSAPSP